MLFAEQTWDAAVTALGILLTGALAAIGGLVVQLRKSKADSRKAEVEVEEQEVELTDKQRKQKQRDSDWAVAQAQKLYDRLAVRFDKIVNERDECRIHLAIVTTQLVELFRQTGKAIPSDLSDLLEKLKNGHPREAAADTDMDINLEGAAS